MAKRFTATEKWDDPFFCNLEAKYKLAWIYLLDKCDNAGIYFIHEISSFQDFVVKSNISYCCSFNMIDIIS